MLLQVHDELIFNVYNDEIDKVKDIVYNTMTKVFELKVPQMQILSWEIIGMKQNK